MLLDGSLILENMGEYDAVYLRQFYDAEASVAQRLLEMSRTVYDVDAGELSNLVAAGRGGDRYSIGAGPAGGSKDGF